MSNAYTALFMHYATIKPHTHTHTGTHTHTQVEGSASSYCSDCDKWILPAITTLKICC